MKGKSAIEESVILKRWLGRGLKDCQTLVDPTQKRRVVCRVVNAFFFFFHKDCFGEHCLLGSMVVSGECTYIRLNYFSVWKQELPVWRCSCLSRGGIFDFQGIWVRTVDDERIQVGMKCICFCIFPFHFWDDFNPSQTVVNICMFHTNTQIDLDVWK